MLGLELHVGDGRLRFHDPATGKDLPTAAEETEGRATAERHAAAERNAREVAKRRADAAERELTRLRLRQKG